MEWITPSDIITAAGVLTVLFGLVVLAKSSHRIGPTEFGLINKKYASKKLSEDSPVAFEGEAGYQDELLMPGLRFKFWPYYEVTKFPWPQVPAGEIGVVISQVGAPLPSGAKSGVYKDVFNMFSDIRTFVKNGGQKGVQRPVLPPGTFAPIHPAFLVITKSTVYGLPLQPDLLEKYESKGGLTPEDFGLQPRDLEVVIIKPEPLKTLTATQNVISVDVVNADQPMPTKKGGRIVTDSMVDTIGLVTTFEGKPSNDIASRIGGFADIAKLEQVVDKTRLLAALHQTFLNAGLFPKPKDVFDDAHPALPPLETEILADAANPAAQAPESDTVYADRSAIMTAVAGIITSMSGKDITDEGDKAKILTAILEAAGANVDAEKVTKAVEQAFADAVDKSKLIEAILENQNSLHESYQNFQAFVDKGGCMGLQHDPLLYGAYILNPFLVKVERVPMLVVEQGQVAVVKAYVGLPTKDTSGENFKHGSLVNPGHRGIWEEPLRTGKFAINPHCYRVEIVPTAILTLNWSNATSDAHDLDQRLSTIKGRSSEGFEFSVDLQVQIHIPDTKASRVISVVATIKNLVDEVLQAAVGNHFRDKLQSMKAVDFIQKRADVQARAMRHIEAKLREYMVETKGVYIQDVVPPSELVTVLKDREIATQEIQTYRQKELAETQRIAMEKQTGMANAQAALATSEVEITIQENNARAMVAKANGEATYIRETGIARAAETEAQGLAKAKGYQAQREAVGETATAIINGVEAISKINQAIVPQVLVAGGGNSLDGLIGTLMSQIAGGNLKLPIRNLQPQGDTPPAAGPSDAPVVLPSTGKDNGGATTAV